MYHGLIQQLIRADPTYYILYVCLRPDRNRRLTSYPYYAKYDKRRNYTFYRHLDMNVREYLNTGRGGNVIQGSVSLDEESETGCTVLVPGFHHAISNCWADVEMRDLKTKNKKCQIQGSVKVWTDHDEEIYGKFQPFPCGRGDARITMPTIPHGSTSNQLDSSGRRRTILPWYVAVDENDEWLDVRESGSFGDIARCHASQSGWHLTPSGLPNRYSTNPQVFLSMSLRRSYRFGRMRMVNCMPWTLATMMLSRLTDELLKFVETCFVFP